MTLNWVGEFEEVLKMHRCWVKKGQILGTA